ncbi:AAA family ATPase [Sulfurimonas sp. SAG-AH-194-C20]|nr:AAA family ATPase [Sulfurimonas sp. SAG-AH-194-C20]MDF1878107.1 AAA family ATPase [Sulfurimonas sp. SAG-AH-194-C20]
MRRRKARTTLEEFDKTQLVDSELIDKMSLWILRIIVKLGGAREFIDTNNCFRNDNLAYFLEVGVFVDMDSEEFKRRQVLAILKKNYTKLEKRKRFTSATLLTQNIQQIIKLMDLNSVEKQILEFSVLLNQYEVLDEAAELLGNSLNTTQAKKALSGILDIPLQDINAAFKANSKFNKSSIVSIDKNDTHSLDRKIRIISDSFADDMLNLDEDVSVMIKDAVRPCDKSTLALKDYEHIKNDIDIVIPYLASAIASKEEGVNILFYGLPGTGKTELAKTISQVLETKLFEISYANEDEEAIDGYERLKAFKIAQSLLGNQNILLMYDEAEDIFNSSDSPFAPKRQDNKAWLNRILETNSIPTIWITNNIHSIDNAMVRRFDFSVEIPIPNKKKRAQIIKNYSNNLLDEKSINVLAQNENIAPALITRATKVVSSLETKDKAKAFTQVLNNTLKAQGHKEIKEKIATLLPNVYDPKFINTTTNLELLTKGIQKHQNARLCLYGAAGTGKSAYGRYIAESLNKPLLLKKGSDLISMYVGGTEKNIAAAFTEAKEEKAVLVFDEVDSFLADRTQAKQSWEVTQVNEMLVQMENFEGIFIATTNLMDNLDKASLRRFDLKLEFDYLKSEQSWNMFLSYCKDLNLKKPSVAFKKRVKNLKYLTPGDFAAVTRQNRFRPISDVKDFISRLEDEVAVKHEESGKVMGFLS